MTIDPPLLTANNETVAEGEQGFRNNCATCHGGQAVAAAGSIGPDLRYSALLRDVAAWNGAVLEGNRAQRGMPGFKASLRPGESEAIQAYVIREANSEKARQEAAVAAASAGR